METCLGLGRWREIGKEAKVLRGNFNSPPSFTIPRLIFLGGGNHRPKLWGVVTKANFEDAVKAEGEKQEMDPLIMGLEQRKNWD